jgi:hypothetical protein
MLIVAITPLAYSTNLGLFAGEIEDQLNEPLHKPIVRWEQAVRVLGDLSTDFLTTRVERFWLQISIFGIAIGISIIVESLSSTLSIILLISTAFTIFKVAIENYMLSKCSIYDKMLKRYLLE